MILNQIVACSSNFVIGDKNKLLWHYKEDLRFFKKMTLNKIIIMGRKTYDSIFTISNKPLQNRFHIVISQKLISSEYDNVTYVQSIAEAYSLSRTLISQNKYPEDVFIIGGAQIYEQTLMDCQNLYVTMINQVYNGDAYYPNLTFLKHFNQIESLQSTETPNLNFQKWILALK